MDHRDQLFTDVLDAAIDGAVRGRDVFGTFMRLSRELIGPAELADWVGRAYLGTLLAGATEPSGPPRAPEYRRTDILAVLAHFERLKKVYASRPRLLAQHVTRELVLSPDTGIAHVTKSIAALWYCAGLIEFDSGMGFLTLAAPKETYAAALAWQAVGGNPMGVPGPYYGNWAYPSPTLIQEPEAEESAEAETEQQAAMAGARS